MLCECCQANTATAEISGAQVCRACITQYIRTNEILRRSEPEWAGPIDKNIEMAEKLLEEIS